MIVCPVCEHAQAQGAECEVCGKRLGAPSVVDPVQPPVEGLEPTGRAAVDVPAAPLPELEPTRHAAAAAADDRTPDLEATRAAPVDVDVEPAADVERTAGGIPGDAPTALPAAVACRYCRTPAGPGERICGRCGMRLPVLASGPAPDAAAEGWRCSCGTLARGSLCPSCGARRGAH
jgi:hypothetical protein